MNVRILQLIEGAKQAKGLTVIIDVFRAFSLEAYLMDAGAERIYPIGEAEKVFALKAEHPDWIAIGERGGKKLDGMDFGNSPSSFEGMDLTGRVCLHTTSAGTQGIANAKGASEIITGSLVNAKAIARYIQASGAEEVSLVAMGLSGGRETEEDTLCAEYIKCLLEGGTMDLAEPIESLKHTSGAKFFDPERAEIFPTRDFELCTMPDRFDFVLKVEKDEDGAGYIKKIPV
ncbi:MAG: 2-phosphosulfolactate phosphatase [Firmicutes bacterium]|nr:2-phosphosulfolactate phosphatase [Bacillota bacterium]